MSETGWSEISGALPAPVREAVKRTREEGPSAHVAFDADGTLWRGDVGEELLRLLAHEDRLPSARGQRGVYAEYERRVARDPADAYAWSVEIMRGLAEGEVMEACASLVAARFAGRLFRPVRQILSALQQAGCPVWIVSASPFWPVLAGARVLGVPEERVIGVRCPIDAGRLTGAVEVPVPCGEGKVQALERLGVQPALAFGNGELDIPMLSYAARAIAVAPPGEDNALTREACVRGWPILRC